MRDFSKEIKAYALKNALEFGKTEAGRILPKLFQHGLDKKDVKQIMPLIVEIVGEVNSYDSIKMQREFHDLKEYVKEAEYKEKGLPELENAGENMVFRLAPYPSGALHIGNAKTYLLNALYAEKYHAKTLFVFDDTIGSEEKQVMPEAYKLIQDAFDWLGVKYEKSIYYKSDRLSIYYEYAEKLIEKKAAYICSCNVKTLRENREKGKACKCRSQSIEENLAKWKKMFNAEEGEYTLRLKTNIKHPNPAFRDRVLFKICERRHPRIGNKHKVWPTLEMSWAIDDYLLGITHIIRGNDLMIETDTEKFIWDIFKWKHPETIHVGLVRIEGTEAKISKSKAQKEVKAGEFMGWDDPRTLSIQSLRRRGIGAKAIREFVEEIGLNKQDISIPIDILYSINRKMIDAESKRYSFVKNPVELKILNKPATKTIQVPVHPDSTDTREVEAGKIFISDDDFRNFKNKEVRLLHLFNIKLGKKIEFTSEENQEIPKINWVSDCVRARVLMSDGKWAEGLAEKAIDELEEGEVIQFERNFFCRFDRVGRDMVYEFWFSHR